MPDKTHTILVVEDEKPLVQAISAKLQRSGFDVATARTVEQATSYMEDLLKVDVVWLDHYLLGQSTGLDFVSTIKGETSPWRNVPIFVVSNTASPDKVQTYLRLGVNKYYTKSDYRLDGIIADIQSYLQNPD